MRQRDPSRPKEMYKTATAQHSLQLLTRNSATA